MGAVDAHDFGSLEWGLRTDGRLSRAERRRMIGAGLRDAAVIARDRLILLTGRGRGRGSVDLAGLDAPDTPLALEAERLARAHQSPAVLAHAFRSVAFAHAIAGLDGVDADPELLWAACLLHDVALERPEEGRCFAVRGGEIARDAALASGADAATAALLGDAVSRHANAGLDPAGHPLPYLVNAGALVDVLGRRLADLDPTFVADVLAAEPRDGFAPALRSAWHAEARAVPGGRAAVAERYLCFSLAARAAPLPS